MSVECKWTSFSQHKLPFMGKEVNFLGLSREKFNVAKSGQHKLVYWEADDSSLSIFVIIGPEVESANMFETARDLIKNAEPDESEKGSIQNVYIPGFKVKVD